MTFSQDASFGTAVAPFVFSGQDRSPPPPKPPTPPPKVVAPNAASPPFRGQPFGPYKGKHLFGITIYANAEGETLSFMFDTLKGLAPLKETITFVDNGIQGSALAPVVLTGSMPAESPPPPPPSPVDCRWDAADSDGRWLH